MIHENILARLKVGLGHEEHAVEAAHTHDGLVNQIRAIGRSDDENPFIGAAIQHAEKSRNLRCDAAFLAIGIGIGSHKLQLIEAEHKRSLQLGSIENALQMVEHALLVDMAQFDTFDDGVIETQFLCKALKHKAFTASRRAIKQHTVDGRQLIEFRFFGVLHGKQHLLAQLFLQVVATRHVVEAIARAFLYGDDRCIGSRSGSIVGQIVEIRWHLILTFGRISQLRHQLLHQCLAKFGSRRETIVGFLGQSLQQNGLHIVGNLDLIGFQDKFLFSSLFDSIGNGFLVAFDGLQIHLPWRMAEDEEIKQGARREDVALHGIH